VSSRTRRIALLWIIFALVVPAVVLAAVRTLPASTATYLVGPKMIRGEIAVRAADGSLHDYRIDRGRLQKRYAGGQLILLERDDTKTPIKVSAAARVLLNGKVATVRALRAGMQVAVPRDGDLPAVAVYAAAKAAPPIPPVTVKGLLGDRMVRAEIALQTPDAVVHDYLLDHGRIRQVGPYTLTLREADGTMVPVSASASVRVRLNGKSASFVQLRKGMNAIVMRDGNKPVDQIWATGK
jgi:hypothetical protein